MIGLSGSISLTEEYKYVCVYEKDHLTIGKVYTSLYSNTYSTWIDIYVENDIGEHRWYNKNLFGTIEEYRDKKLNDLLK